MLSGLLLSEISNWLRSYYAILPVWSLTCVVCQFARSWYSHEVTSGKKWVLKDSQELGSWGSLGVVEVIKYLNHSGNGSVKSSPLLLQSINFSTLYTKVHLSNLEARVTILVYSVFERMPVQFRVRLTKKDCCYFFFLLYVSRQRLFWWQHLGTRKLLVSKSVLLIAFF
jgi:hypothetical protein